MGMCTFEYAAFSCEIYLGKNQTLTTLSKVAKDSDKGTDLDIFSTLGI